MSDREHILQEIKRTALENGGVPLGAARFRKETGITPWEWEQFWARFGDALQEAGYAPNQFQGAYADEFLIRKIVGLIRKLKKFPTSREITTEKRHDSELPSRKVFERLGAKRQIAQKVFEYCAGNPEFGDVAQICKSVVAHASKLGQRGDQNGRDQSACGEVYLFKSGRYYKIGKTTDSVRRGKEIRIQLPERINLVHSIKTDDPSGVECYWHNRFAAKRKNGEWFDLSVPEVRAFKRWKHIF